MSFFEEARPLTLGHRRRSLAPGRNGSPVRGYLDTQAGACAAAEVGTGAAAEVGAAVAIVVVAAVLPALVGRGAAVAGG